MALQVLTTLSTTKDGPDMNGALVGDRVAKKTTETKSKSGNDSKPKSTPDPRSRSPGESRAKQLSPVKAKSIDPKPKPHLNKYFRLFLIELLKMFGNNRPLLEKKGTFIIRLASLCIRSAISGFTDLNMFQCQSFLLCPVHVVYRGILYLLCLYPQATLCVRGCQLCVLHTG